MNGTIRVKGGRRLVGEVTPIPNKNSVLCALTAPILTGDDCVFENIPDSTDVKKTLAILEDLGARVVKDGGGRIIINCKDLKSSRVGEIGRKFRASILFVGPLLARFGKAQVPLPGGCLLGRRSIAAHIDVFTELGAKISIDNGTARFSINKDNIGENLVWQFEASPTATENFFLFASLIPKKLTLFNAALEPHVTDLLLMLGDMGVGVEGVGSNKVVIKGKSGLKGFSYSPRPDHVDISGFIVASAITKGNIRIKGGNVGDIMDGIVKHFELFNISIKKDGDDLLVDGSADIRIDSSNSSVPLALDSLPKFKPQPWPGFPVDCLPPVVTLACKMEGRVLIQNWMYETGLDFIRELNAMGARIFMSDPQRVIVSGPVTFTGGEVFAPGIIQACKAIFLASLCDDAVTTIHGVDILKRRYPNIIETYKSLGADIEAISP